MTQDQDVVQFGTMLPGGEIMNARVIQRADIGACPHVIFIATHYREDGSCRCDDPNDPDMPEWGYSWTGGRWE